MEVDENVLPLEVLPMVAEILPSAEESKLLREWEGDAAMLDKPELLLRSLSAIPRLEGRLRAMMFKGQLEVEMDGLLMQQARPPLPPPLPYPSAPTRRRAQVPPCAPTERGPHLSGRRPPPRVPCRLLLQGAPRADADCARRGERAQRRH